jgi:hypothetical protein
VMIGPSALLTMAFMPSSPSGEQAGTKARFHCAVITGRDRCEGTWK